MYMLYSYFLFLYLTCFVHFLLVSANLLQWLMDLLLLLQLHEGMCKILSEFYGKVLTIFPDLEAARPRSTSGIQALCSLHIALEKTKIILQHCAECSKVYLVRTFCLFCFIYLMYVHYKYVNFLETFTYLSHSWVVRFLIRHHTYGWINCNNGTIVTASLSFA